MPEWVDWLFRNPLILLALVGWVLPAIVKAVQKSIKAGQGQPGRPGQPGQKQGAPRAPGGPRTPSPTPTVSRVPPPKPAPQQTLKELFPELFGEARRPEPPAPAFEPEPAAVFEGIAPEMTEEPPDRRAPIPPPVSNDPGGQPGKTVQRRVQKKVSLDDLHERLGSNLRYAVAMQVLLNPPLSLQESGSFTPDGGSALGP